MSQAHAIAIDLGGTLLRAARISGHGEIEDRIEVPTLAEAGAETVIQQIVDLADRILKHAGGQTISGIGICAPGPLDTKNGIALSIPTIRGFENIPLLNILREKIALPVVLENDAIAAAIGEWKFGAGQGFENLVYVTVSTGIGGGIILGNKVLHGRLGMAGHIGHMIIQADGALCKCGGRGCFEAYASGPAFRERAQAKAAARPDSCLNSQINFIEPKMIFAAAANGDNLAQELVLEQAKLLGLGFASLAHLFNPDLFIMGGGISQAFDFFAPSMLQYFKAQAMPAFKNTPIRQSQLGINSGLFGAAHLVFAANQKQ